jgi:hypothetical protein
LHVHPLMWIGQYGFTRGAVLLVFCSDKYDAADYIREYSEFYRIKREAAS